METGLTEVNYRAVVYFFPITLSNIDVLLLSPETPFRIYFVEIKRGLKADKSSEARVDDQFNFTL